MTAAQAPKDSPALNYTLPRLARGACLCKHKEDVPLFISLFDLVRRDGMNHSSCTPLCTPPRITRGAQGGTSTSADARHL